MVEALQRGASNESLVCVAAYVLGEYGRLLSDVPVQAQFLLLHERFAALSSDAKARHHTALLDRQLACPAGGWGRVQHWQLSGRRSAVERLACRVSAEQLLLCRGCC